MTKVATRAPRPGDFIQNEYGTHVGFCRKTVTVNESAETEYKVGRVLSREVANGTATATADSGNTGDGTIGAITVGAKADIGNYRLTITDDTGADSGDFVVEDPRNQIVGFGTVGEEFIGGGLTFTLSDGAADFVTGDFFVIEVSGDEQYNTIEAGETFAGFYIGSDAEGNAQTVAASTDTEVVVLYRGPCTIGEDLLVYGSSVDTDAEKAAIRSQIEAAGFKIQKQPNQLA